MKIAMVCPFFLPVVGGMEKHVYNLSLQLQKRGHEVTVFTSKIDHSGREILKSREKIHGIEVRRFKPYFRLGNFASFWPQFSRQLGDFDIVHAHNLRHPHSELSLLAGKRRKIPVILTPHSPYHSGTHSPLQELAIKIYDGMISRISLRHFDAVFALHDAERKWLVRKGVPSSKVRVIPNGIENAFFRGRGGGKGKNQVIYVGRISEAKGLDLLLKAFAILPPGMDAKLLLVGPDGGQTHELKRFAEKTHLGRSVSFTGEVPEQKLVRLLDESAVFVLPSKYEPFGISLLEAMARGKACIAVRSEGPESIIENGKEGLLINYSVSELAEGIRRLLGSAALRKKLGNNARKKAEKYGWPEIASEVEKEYGKLVHSG